MPENFPGITFDKNGVCSFCRQRLPEAELRQLKKQYKNRFLSLIRTVAGKGDYDVLMCYSGGKDSTYTLGLLRNEYKLRVLAFTFDNGFIPERTYLNIRNAVEKLDVDHIIFKARFSVLKKIFKTAARKSLYPAKALERASTICTSCMAFIKYLSLRIAIEKRIPCIAFGWSPGQAPVTSSVLKIDPAMICRMEKVLKGPLAGIVGNDIGPYFLNDEQYSRPERFPCFVHPLAFVHYDEKKILRAIQKFGWRKPYGVDLNATNCLLNSFADEAHIAKYGFHPYLLEIAGFVRDGYMKRSDGLRHLPVRKNKKIVDMVKRRLGL